MKRLFALSLSLVTVVMLYGCGGSDKPQAPAGGEAAQQAGIPPVGTPVVEVPDVIKGKWKSVVLTVEDKEKGSTKDYTVGIGSKFKVPGSDLTVEVKEFFPAFVMQGSSITSMSNETINPAAMVSVAEGGAEVFSGWLFAKYPTTHAFTHPKFAIMLKEGVPN